MTIDKELKEQLKQIPILEVCSTILNITPIKRSNSYWCKCRPEERTASTRLYIEDNSFYDYGSHEGGDVIELVRYTLGIDFVSAAKLLQEAFHIPDPKDQRSPSRFALMDWEYQAIGLYGDRATKNFTFDVERMPMERIQQISEKYAMPMNELRLKHPKTYKRLLLSKAFPYLRALRANYLISVWNHYLFCRQHVTPDYFYMGDLRQRFGNDLKPLETAEHILRKAVHNTGISLPKVPTYDPALDLDKLLGGQVKPDLGKLTYSELQSLAESKGCRVKYRTVPYHNFTAECALEKYPYTAFLKAGNVTIGFLETDYAALDPVLDAMRPLEKQRYPRKPIPVPRPTHTAKGKGTTTKDPVR